MIPDVVARLIGDNSAYVRSLNEAERATKGSTDRSSGHFSKLGGAIGTAMKVGAAAGVGAIGAFAVKAISGASDLAETLSKVGVVFGDQAHQVTGFANDMAKSFGLPKTAIMDAAAGIGLIGKASGLSQGDAAKMSTQLGKLAADASSFYNVPLPEALDAIKSGLVGEAEPMRRFGVLLNEQAVSAEAARLGLQKVNGEYSEGAKAQARASLIMSGMKDASGDLERTQGSLANRLREVQGRVSNFATEAGTRAIPVVIGLMDGAERLAPVIGGVLAGAFDVAKTAAGVAGDAIDFLAGVVSNPVFQVVAGIIATTLIPVLVALGVAATISAAKSVAAWVTMQVASITGSVTTYAALVKAGLQWIWMGVTSLASAAKVAAAWIISMGPIALVVAAVIGLAVVFVRNWETIRSAVLTGVMFVVDKFLWLVESITKQAAAAFGWVPGIGPKLREAAKAVERFRDDTNAYLAGIRDKTIRVNYVVTEQLQERMVPGRFRAKFHSGGIVGGPRGAEVPITAQAGEGVFTPGQMAALGVAMGTAGTSRGRGTTTVNNTINVYTATGDIPDSTIRKLRAQLFEMGNDLPPGSIVPAA